MRRWSWLPQLDMTITEALSAAQTLGVDRLEAQLLLLHALGKSHTERGWLLAHDLDALPASTEAAFLALAQRRVANEPLAYLTGRVEFFGLELFGHFLKCHGLGYFDIGILK